MRELGEGRLFAPGVAGGHHVGGGPYAVVGMICCIETRGFAAIQLGGWAVGTFIVVAF